ncbi:MAG: AAA family ATPase [Candidatus Aminicenantes bacterium]|nr:AAA family ATPase [Candidatus Aminicenantes bacterium]
MITTLRISRFKSIKSVAIDCKRINLLIGEPNSGKSNILESLALFSWQGHNGNIHDFSRFEEPQDLFYDGLFDEKIEIDIEEKQNLSMEIGLDDGNFKAWNKIAGEQKYVTTIKRDTKNPNNIIKEFSFMKYYRFLKQSGFENSFPGFLLPPSGNNLFSLVMGNKAINDWIRDFFIPFDLRFMLETREKSFKVVKERDNLLITYPYSIISDTLQRIIFFTAAMMSNKESLLIFEEPESFAFPYYTKYLGERIAFDKNNQYFISTHNPYLLLAILEKTPKNDINVLVTYLENHQTRLKSLNPDEIAILMDTDPFFNLDRFLDGEKK